MSVSVQIDARAIASAVPRPVSARFIGGPLFDAMFFLFPVLAGFAFVFVAHCYSRNAQVLDWLNTTVISLGFAHAMGTYFFYLDRENFKRYSARPFKFFAVPVLLVVWSISLAQSDHVGLLYFISFAWVNFHLTRQNTGFVNFYRQKCGVNSPEQRACDNQMIYSTALFCCGLGWINWPAGGADDFLPSLRPYLFWPFMATLVWVAVSWVRAVPSLVRAMRGTGGAAWPHLAMVATSLIFPLPFLFTGLLDTGSYLLFGVMSFGLLPHYLQYIALLTLIHLHKYPAMLPSPDHEEARAPQASGLVLGRFAVNGAVVFLLFITATTLTFHVLLKSLGSVDQLKSVALGVLVGSGLVHYWLDGLIFAMRNEGNRKSILPYLKPLRA